ncbi:MAG TPA: peptidoglycan -binding protein [Acetobacteraceae bacterium]|jgi:chemotaxis protein MotB|nr:peptidoglycan -binding protein [Acetobacteraceae bacterium]
MRTRRYASNGLDAWPGYVDALSTLLMVIIFVLLVFVLTQAFLSVVLSGRDKALDQVKQQLSQLTDALSLERSHSSELQASLAQLNSQLSASDKARDTLSSQLATLQARSKDLLAQRDALLSQVQQLGAQRETATTQLGESNAKLADTQNQLAAAQQQLADMKQQMAELDKTVTADKATIQARLSDLAKLQEQVQALSALRDQLESQAQDAAAKAMTEQQRREAVALELANEKKLGDSAAAQIALLNQTVDQLKAQLSAVSQALDLAQKSGRDKDVQIANLGQKLNAALAAKVQELQQYRSEFFGKLREVLAGRPGIQIVGDRFVFQSEVLFPLGSADLTQQGVAQMTALAITIKDIATEIPPDLHWVLQVDGFTDPQPIKPGAPFASNWELSSARAITVVKLLIADGVPPAHLAAAAFGEFQPFAPGDTPEAYRKDRRIELRLTN